MTGPITALLGRLLDLPVGQTGDRFGNAVEVLLQGYELVGAALGLFIAYQAYRGYRRNDSRPMFFISAGFIFITGLPVLFFVAFLLLPSIPQYGLQAAVQTLEVVGLLCIIYALRVDA